MAEVGEDNSGALQSEGFIFPVKFAHFRSLSIWGLRYCGRIVGHFVEEMGVFVSVDLGLGWRRSDS